MGACVCRVYIFRVHIVMVNKYIQFGRPLRAGGGVRNTLDGERGAGERRRQRRRRWWFIIRRHRTINDGMDQNILFPALLKWQPFN